MRSTAASTISFDGTGGANLTPMRPLAADLSVTADGRLDDDERRSSLEARGVMADE